MKKLFLVVLPLLLLDAADVAGQRRQISLEFTPVHGTIGYGWAVGPDRYAGVEFGFGFPQIDRLLRPAEENFVDISHVGGFYRVEPHRSVTLDMRGQIGIAELRGCSGCVPGLFTAASAGAYWGGSRVKIGPRLFAGIVNEYREPAAFVFNLRPVSLLLTHRW